MVRLNLFSTLVLGASVASAADCTVTQAVTAVSTIPVFAGHHTGEVKNTASVVFAPAPTFDLKPKFEINVPIGAYPNAIGFNVEIGESSKGLTIESDSWELFSGDINDFAQLDSSVFSVNNNFEFVGLTHDPLFKVGVSGDISDSSLASYSAEFVIFINLPDSGAIHAKRELLPITVNLTVDNPNVTNPTGTTGASSQNAAASGVASSVASASVSASSVASASVSASVSASAAAVSSASLSANTDDTVISTTTPTVTANNVTSSTATVYKTVSITITSCSDNKCSTIVEPAVVSAVTTVIGDVTSIYTTTCPLSTESIAGEATQKVLSTITQTITSCVDHKCSTFIEEAAVSEVSTVINNATTIYTTTCPISSATQTPTSSVVSNSSVDAAVTTKTPVSPTNSTSSEGDVTLTATNRITLTATAKTSSEGLNVPTLKPSAEVSTTVVTSSGSTVAPASTTVVTSSGSTVALASTTVVTSSGSTVAPTSTDLAIFEGGAAHVAVGGSLIAAVFGAFMLI